MCWNIPSIACFSPWLAVCSIYPVLFIWHHHCCNYWRATTMYRKWLRRSNVVCQQVPQGLEYTNKSLVIKYFTISIREPFTWVQLVALYVTGIWPRMVWIHFIGNSYGLLQGIIPVFTWKSYIAKTRHLSICSSIIRFKASTFKVKCRMLLLHETMGQQCILFETDNKKKLWHLEIQKPVL